MSGGETSEDGVAVSDCQTAAAAAAAAAVVSGSRLTHAVSPALGYYFMPGSGVSIALYVILKVVMEKLSCAPWICYVVHLTAGLSSSLEFLVIVSFSVL